MKTKKATNKVHNKTNSGKDSHPRNTGNTRNRSHKGFTLIEIMVVIIIIAVLASVAGPMISGVTDKGKKSATQAQLGNIKSALVNYRGDVGFWPACVGSTGAIKDIMSSSVQAKNCLFSNVNAGGTGVSSSWSGPYMEDEPKEFMVDAWGTSIVYITVGTDGASGAFLLSAGINGTYNTVLTATLDGTLAPSYYDGVEIANFPAACDATDLWAVVFRKG